MASECWQTGSLIRSYDRSYDFSRDPRAKRGLERRKLSLQVGLWLRIRSYAFRRDPKARQGLAPGGAVVAAEGFDQVTR